jgi:hypothetical protein
LSGRSELSQPFARQAILGIELQDSFQAVDLLRTFAQHHAQQQPPLLGVRVLLHVAREQWPSLGRPPGPDQVPSLAQFLR